MGEFSYLPEVIVFTYLLYLSLALLIYYFYTQSLRNKDESYRTQDISIQAYHFFRGKPIEHIYLPSIKQARAWGKYSILIFGLWRMICFCFFFGIALLWTYILVDGNNATYFTLWNLDMISLYYFLTSIYSIFGFCYHQEYDQIKRKNPLQDEYDIESMYWSKHVLRISCLIQIIFEVIGATALFVTIVDFITLDQHFDFINTIQHFMTTICFLIEGYSNSMHVRWEHSILHLCWPVIYLTFIWPMVRLGGCSEWPYFFLETDSPIALVYIVVLFAVDILFYCIWYCLYRLKMKYVVSMSSESLSASWDFSAFNPEISIKSWSPQEREQEIISQISSPMTTNSLIIV